MRLLLDGAAFQNAHQRGIQRYFTELLARLPAEADIRIALSAGARAPLPPRATPVRTDLGLCAVLPRRARPIVQRLVATPLSRRLARSCEVFHATYYTRPPAASLPSVLTVYDMIAERFGDSFPSLTADREIDRKRAAILAADRIITISYHAAAELRSIYPEVAGRITAIPLGHEHALRGTGLKSGSSGVERPFALFVGDRAGYKNFRIIAEALAESAWPPKLAVAFVGPPWRDEELALIDRSALASRVIHLGRVGDDRLASLYTAAACVIVPSLAEGFGFPIVEAQGAPAPLVCSDIPVFREVAGSAALFFDPRDPAALASRVAESIEPANAQRLRTACPANLSRFTWDECARRTWEVYLGAARRA